MAPAKTTRKRASPKPEAEDDIVHIAKAEGPTKFQQMRKFLAKANESDKPVDLLAGFLSERPRTSSPSRRLSSDFRSPGSPDRRSVGSLGSPVCTDFHTGLTPTSSGRRAFPPAPVFSRRDSEEGFAASDLLLHDGKAASNRIGTFIHGQRAVSLRQTLKSGPKTGGLLLEDIPNVDELLAEHSKLHVRQRIFENTLEEDGKENFEDLDEIVFNQ